MADGYGFQPGQQTVDYSVLVRRTAEASFLAFKELCDSGPEQSDTEKKIGLLKFITKTRQRLLRLLVLSKWCCQIPLVECCQQLVGTLSNHDTSFTQAADSLFFLHEGLQQARAPLYDIPSALEVLLTGNYGRLPKCIEDLGMQPILVGEEKESSLQKLDTLLRSRLLDISLPKELSAVKVANGRVTLLVDGEFEVQLTLGYRGNPTLWRVLHLELLVGESGGKIRLTDIQRSALGDDLERRMAALDNPFVTLYLVLHEFCAALVMDTVLRQVRALRQGRWKDAIRFEIISDGSLGQGPAAGQGQGQALEGDAEISGGKSLFCPGLRIMYWLDLHKGGDATPPSLKIEPGPDHHIACSHQSSVFDPFTNNEAEFVLDQSCIDVEKLLLRAISCNVHSRLLELQRELKSGSQLCQVDSDVVLKLPYTDGCREVPGKSDAALTEETTEIDAGEIGEEVLCVRAYGQSYLTLGINIRNGKYLLRSQSTLLAASVMTEMEEALNQGSITPLDVFISLRNRSLLHLFASIGTSLNLKLYEKGAPPFKILGDTPKLGSDVLIMGFPNCGDSYFLSLELDNNFMPSFTLMQGQLEVPLGPLATEPVQIVRYMKIDMDSFYVSEDEVNSSLLDEGRLEVQERGLVSNLDHFGKEANIAGVTKGVRALESGALSKFIAPGGEHGQNVGSSAEKIIGHDKGGLSSGQFYKQSIAFATSPSSQPGIGGRVGLNNQSTNGNSPLFQGNAAGKFSPSSSISSRFMPEANLKGTRQTANAGYFHAVGTSGSAMSPSKILSFQKLTPGSKPLYHSEPESLLSKSPVNIGDHAASPINLDDDDLSKLIDSISSKTASMPSGGPSLTDDGILMTASGSRQARTSTPSRSSPLHWNSGSNVRTTFSKSSLLRNAVQSPSTSARTASPVRRSPVPESLSGKSDGASESPEMGETLQSASFLLASPTRLATSLTSGQPMQGTLAHATLSFGKLKQDSAKRKRKGSDLIFSLPSLQGLTADIGRSKRRKIELEACQTLIGTTSMSLSTGNSSSVLDCFMGHPYASIITAANQGKAPVCSYAAVLLQVVRRCSLCIKHARLTSQMDSLGIPYVEEVGLRRPSTNLWFRLPVSKVPKESRLRSGGAWEHICLCLGRPGSAGWSVKIQDDHFKGLWELQRQRNVTQWGSAVQVITPEADSHIRCTSKGLLLNYESLEGDSIKRLFLDLERLWSARTFALGIKRLLENRVDERGELGQDKSMRSSNKGVLGDKSEGEKMWEAIKRSFRIEAVGLTSIWFSYMSSLLGVIARFVVEWETGKEGCTMHVSPDQLWPHTKYLEDYINGGEVELLLDCIRVTAGPLHSLGGAIRPARMPVATASIATATMGGVTASAKPTPHGLMIGPILSPSASAVTSPQANPGRPLGASLSINTMAVGTALQTSQTGPSVSGPGRGTGLVPSSLLPTDVSVVLRSPYWIRIVYRRQFAVDMRCFAGDQVWLQPAPPPRGVAPGTRGSLPCPQFRPFVMEQITTGFNSSETSTVSNASGLTGQGGQPGSTGGIVGSAPNLVQASGGVGSRVNTNSVGINQPGLGSSGQAAAMLNRVGNLGAVLGSQGLVPGNALTSGRGFVPGVGMGFHPSYRELNVAGYGFSDDGGYGGVWVSLGALKKVLRGTLRYLGVVWLFAQFPSIIRDVLASHLKESEGALLNHDPETPALRFYIQNCVFAVSVLRQQLVLQAINVKRYQHPQAPQQQHQQQQSQAVGSDSDLSLAEMQEIGDFFARRAAFEPYDASRLASFVTMLTLPVPVLREFIGLIAWKKDANKAAQQGHATDATQMPRPRVELCLENRSGYNSDANALEDSTLQASGGSGLPKSSIRYDRPRNTVDFTLTVILDPANVPHINLAGGAGWLPQCVAVRLRYVFGDSNQVFLLNMEGSHGGRACWSRLEDWERCKDKVTRAVESTGGSIVQEQGRLRSVAETVQIALQSALQQLRKGVTSSPPNAGSL